jgi:hypothetical protein
MHAVMCCAVSCCNVWSHPGPATSNAVRGACGAVPAKPRHATKPAARTQLTPGPDFERCRLIPGVACQLASPLH